MPELPEVETIRRQLEKVLVGQVIRSVEVRHKKSWQGNAKDVVGKKVVEVNRKAKMLMVGLANQRNSEILRQAQDRLAKQRLFLLIHLKMTGQLIYQASRPQGHKAAKRIVGGHPTSDWVNELPSKHTRVIIKLDRGTLFFNDQRVFGWIKTAQKSKVKSQIEMMPPDVIDKEMTKERFYKILQGSRRAIKLVIMDQAKIGGVGNIYANDGLWEARINPKKSAREITKSESDKLLEALKRVVNLGIKYGGATASDENYVNASGLGGKYQEHFLVYERAGERCKRPKCRGIIKKIRIGGRGTYYCPACQK